MIRKAPKCFKGFPCGKTCINRNNKCWANLSTTNNKVAETFSQFVNRLVGIGTPTQSVINNGSINSINNRKRLISSITNNDINKYLEGLKEDFDTKDINDDLFKNKDIALAIMNYTTEEYYNINRYLRNQKITTL